MNSEKLKINHGEHKAHRDNLLKIRNIFSVISVRSVVKTDFLRVYQL